MTRIQLNGQWTRLDADPHTALLYAIRQSCKGTRFGCGSGHCGACTVALNGRAVAACDTPVWSADNQPVQTVEYLTTTRVGAIVHQAFLEHQAAQCGYCINGIQVALIARLREQLSMSRADVLALLDKHLCRCGAHARILRAVDTALQRVAHLSLQERQDDHRP